jgi:hypothetical protein
MHPEGQELGFHSVVSPLLEVAERIEGSIKPGVPHVLSTWLQREVHLAAVRHAELLQLGVPEETAQFLALDDPGYQIARTASDYLDDYLPG